MAPTMAVPWLEIGYYLVAGFFLLRLSLGLALSLRLLARAVPVCPAWAGDTSIRISRDIAAPVTVAHVILLPWDAVNWPAGMRTAVLAHERAHLARWDFAMLVASQVNRAVFWFSPLSWWLHRRLATLAELASDDQAMATTGDRLGYATILLEMGRRSGASLRGVAMARPSTLRYRIERILADGVTTDSVRPIEQVMLALGAAGFSIFAASSGPVPVDAGWPAPMPSSPVQITSALQASPVSLPMAPLVPPIRSLDCRSGGGSAGPAQGGPGSNAVTVARRGAAKSRHAQGRLRRFRPSRCFERTLGRDAARASGRGDASGGSAECRAIVHWCLPAAVRCGSNGRRRRYRAGQIFSAIRWHTMVEAAARHTQPSHTDRVRG